MSERFQLTNEREEIQLALKSTPVVLDGTPLLLVVVQDIREELDEKETDSWVRLIRVLTHEIMNTITPITAISTSILKYYHSEDGEVLAQLDADKIKSAAKGLTVIKEQGNDLMDFVQGYRSFLNVPKPDKRLVPAGRFFGKVQVLMQLEAYPDIAIKWTLSEPEMDYFIDEKQLTQVLINLVANALHSLENQPNGRIEVISGIDRDNRKYILVKDNGPGIPKELTEDIFVPFFTTKEKGTGIGLSLSRQIMQLHGGSLKLYSKKEGETGFLMTF